MFGSWQINIERAYELKEEITMEITKSVVLKDNENSTEKNLWHGVFPYILRDMVKNKTNERVPKELEMREQSRSYWLFELFRHQSINFQTRIFMLILSGEPLEYVLKILNQKVGNVNDSNQTNIYKARRKITLIRLGY